MATVVRRRRFGLGGFFLLLLVLAAGVLLGMWVSSRHPAPVGGMEYTVAFRDSQGLRPGDPVTLAGKTIGSVRSVEKDTADGEVRVHIGIEKDYASQIKAPPDSSARIRSGGVLFPTRRVEIVNRGSSTASMKPGEMVRGLEDWASEQAFVGKQRAEKGIGAVISATEESLDEAKKWANGPKADQMQAQIESVRQDLQALGVQAAGDAKEKTADLLQRGRELTMNLYASGREDLAAKLESSLGELNNRLGSDDADSAQGVIIKPTPSPTEGDVPAPPAKSE